MKEISPNGTQAGGEADNPTAVEIAAAVENILRAPELIHYEQLGRLLSYLINETTSGHGDELTARTIAINALGFGDDFDPSRTSVIRVHASRLRTALYAYNASINGKNAHVRITLRPGTYIPEIDRNHPEAQIPELDPQPGSYIPEIDQDESEQSPGKAAGPDPKRSWYGLISAAIGIVLSVAIPIGLGLFYFNHATGAGVASGERLNVANGTHTTLPEIKETGAQATVLIQIDAQKSGDESIDKLARDIANVVRNDISQFSDLTVATDQSDRRNPLSYRLTISGNRESHNEVTLISIITFVNTGEIVWSSQSGEVNSNDKEAISDIGRKIAATIGYRFGVIFTDVPERFNASNNKELRCSIKAYKLLRGIQGMDSAAIRNCLEKMADANPRSVSTKTLLAFTLHHIYVDGLPGKGPEDAKLALSLAQSTREIAPLNTLDQIGLAVAEFQGGSPEEAVERMKQVVAADPFAAVPRAEYGSELIRRGEFDKGLSFIKTVLQPADNVPLWFEGYAALGYYMLGDIEQASKFMGADHQAYRPFSLLMRLLICGKQGNGRCLKETAAELNSSYPSYASNIDDSLEREGVAPQIAAKLIEDLRIAGIEGTKTGSLRWIGIKDQSPAKE